MNIIYRQGDLFKFLNGSQNTIYIPHVCNDCGKWGSGFVVPLGKIFPDAKESYLKWSKKQTFGLGKTRFVTVQDVPKIVVANMVAQTLGGKRPLFYNHLVECMETVAVQVLAEANVEIFAPKFGSCLAGGNWDFIAELIRDIWIYRGIQTTIFSIEKTK